MTLQPTINPPTLGDDPGDGQAHQLNNYFLLVNLFRPFDDALVALWMRTRAESSPPYVLALQKQLSDRIPPYMNGLEPALNDLRANQQWLKTVSWQLGMQDGRGAPNGDEQRMQLQYPIDATCDLGSVTSQFQTQSAEVLGVPFVVKLLDLVSSLTDFLTLQPPSSDPFCQGPREYLVPLLHLQTALRAGEHHFLPLLLSKVHDVLPKLANPMLQRVPDNACSVDIFDGFGNAGMAYEPKQYAPPPPDMYADSSSSNGAPASNEMHSPFSIVTSPIMVSPKSEYPGMPDFSSIPDINVARHPQGAFGHQAQTSFSPQQQPHQGFASNVAPTYSQSSAFGQMNQNMLGNVLQRSSIPGSNNAMPHQPHQHIARPVEGYRAMPHTSSNNMAMNSLGISSAGPEMDFSAFG